MLDLRRGFLSTTASFFLALGAACYFHSDTVKDGGESSIFRMFPACWTNPCEGILWVWVGHYFRYPQAVVHLLRSP